MLAFSERITIWQRVAEQSPLRRRFQIEKLNYGIDGITVYDY